jgi:hypothetical protein
VTPKSLRDKKNKGRDDPFEHIRAFGGGGGKPLSPEGLDLKHIQQFYKYLRKVILNKRGRQKR